MNKVNVQWGGAEELDFKKNNDKFFGLTFRSENGVFLGRFKGMDLKDNSKTHIIVTSPVRNGTATTVQIPTLMSGWNESAFIYDVKGERYHLTSATRKYRFDNMILRFSPWENESQGYNPFEEIPFFTVKEDLEADIISKAVVQNIKDENIRKISDYLFKTLIFRLVIKKILPKNLFVSSQKIEIKNYMTFLDIYNELKTFDVYNLSTFGKIPFAMEGGLIDKLKEIYGLDKITEHPLERKYINLLSGISESQLIEALNELKSQLVIFTNLNLAKNTEKSDFKITDLVNHVNPVSLYYVAHPNHFGDDLMARIMISQLIEKVTIELPFNGYYIPSKHRLLFMLPDFCKIGKIPVYENSMGYMAGYGFKSLIFIDGISELERLYGKNNLIMLNSQVQLFYTNTDERTIEYVDNLLITDKREVVKLSTGNGILKVSGRKPLLVDKTVYFTDKEMREYIKFLPVIPESLKDVKKQYKLIDDKKYKYIPYSEAIKKIKESLTRTELVIKNQNIDTDYIGFPGEYSRNTEMLNEFIDLYNKNFPSAPKISNFELKQNIFISGNAEWASSYEINSELYNYNLTGNEGVVLGILDGQLLVESSKGHIMMIMPPRSGKGITSIIPTLLKSWKKSVFVLDVKGENYALTSGSRKQNLDNDILRFSLRSENSCRYNPLAEVRINYPEEKEDIAYIAKELIRENSDMVKNGAYIAKARKIFSNVLTYLLYEDFWKNLDLDSFSVSNLTLTLKDVKSIFKSFSTFSEWIENIKDFESFFDFENVQKKYPNNFYPDILKKYDIQGNAKNLENSIFQLKKIMSDYKHDIEEYIDIINYSLSFLENSTISNNLSGSDFKMIDIMNGKNPVSFYYVISPADLLNESPILRIFMKQMIDKLTSEDLKENHKHELLLLMDEFSAPGRLECLEESIGYLAGYKIKLMIILQSLYQLKKIYGEFEGFSSNCGIQVFSQANDEITAKYVSELLGKQKKTKSYFEDYLLSSSEAMKLPSDKIIIKKFGRQPVQANKFIYFQNKEYYNYRKIPYVFSESLYDRNMKYIPISSDLRKEFDYEYKYLPSKFAVKLMESNLKEQFKLLEIDRERQSKEEIDENFRNAYQERVFGYKVKSTELKKVQEIYKNIIL